MKLPKDWAHDPKSRLAVMKDIIKNNPRMYLLSPETRTPFDGPLILSNTPPDQFISPTPKK